MGGPDFDAIVALGTRLGADGTPSAALRRRAGHAASLFNAGRAPWLVLCGGVGARPPAEAEAMRDLALAAGVPADRILLEPASRNTFENAVNAADILSRRGCIRILVVTDGYHLPRALMVFRRLGFAAAGSAALGGRREPAWFAVGARVREAAAWVWYVYRLLVRDRRAVAAVRARTVRARA